MGNYSILQQQKARQLQAEAEERAFERLERKQEKENRQVLKNMKLKGEILLSQKIDDYANEWQNMDILHTASGQNKLIDDVMDNLRAEYSKYYKRLSDLEIDSIYFYLQKKYNSCLNMTKKKYKSDFEEQPKIEILQEQSTKAKHEKQQSNIITAIMVIGKICSIILTIIFGAFLILIDIACQTPSGSGRKRK